MHAAGQYLSPAASSWGESLSALRWHPPVHELGWSSADRLRRLSDLFAAALSSHERRRCPVSQLCRRKIVPPLARIQYGDAADDRRRHHDGARPVHPLYCLVRASRGGYGTHTSLGRTFLTSQRRFAPGAVWHCAGSLPSRSQKEECHVSQRASL